MNELKNITNDELKMYAQNQTLLIVEDDEDMQVLLKKRLKDLFYKIDIASNGKEGLEKYTKNSYHIILSDIRMPEMDGIDFLENIRKNDLEQKVIFMSAHDDSYYYNRLINANANGFVLKPIKMNLLINILYINSKSLYEKEEHENNIKRIERLYNELSCKNTELTKVNLKFRYIYKKLKDKLEEELDEVISKRKFNLNDLIELNDETNKKECSSSMQNENSEIKKVKSKVENEKPLLTRHKISAKKFLEEIEFFKFEDEMREDLDEMQDLEEDIKVLIDNSYENQISPEVVDKIVALFSKYAEILNLLTSFDTIKNGINSLIYNIKNMDLEKINQDSKTFLDYIYMMIMDLKNWKDSLFIEQNIEDIHYLDDSLLNNCIHIEQYISGEKNEDNDEEDDDNMFFF